MFGSSVTITSLIGQETGKIDKPQWQGAWIEDGALKGLVVHVKVIDVQKGEILLIIVDVKGDEELIHKMKMYVRKDSDAKYINFQEEDPDDYIFSKYVINKNKIYEL